MKLEESVFAGTKGKISLTLVQDLIDLKKETSGVPGMFDQTLLIHC